MNYYLVLMKLWWQLLNIYLTQMAIIINGVFLIYSTNECTRIETYTVTYIPLILRHVSIFLDNPQGVLHQTSIYKTHSNYQQIKILLVIKSVLLLLLLLLLLPINIFINGRI